MDGQALPFGAEVTDADGRSVGVVAQDSRIFARGLDDKGVLVVKLGENVRDVCRVQYSLPVKGDKAGLAYLSIESHCVNDALTASAERDAVVDKAVN
jgi:outer membrane usher protein